MLEHVLKEPFLKEIDIVVKCKKYPEFYKELQELDKAYSASINMSLYMDLTHVENQKVFDIMKRDKLYINFYGFRMNKKTEE